MTAPTEALNKFWESLREKSRVRIESPDLPEDLREAAGELTAALWNKAQAAAGASLKAQREMAHAEVMDAQAAKLSAEAKVSALQAELEAERIATSKAESSAADLSRQLSAERATRASLEERLTQAQNDQAKLHESLAEARRDFSAELDKIRATAELAEERLRAAEARALIEIDRERAAAARTQKDLESARRLALEAEERSRVDLAALQQELLRTRQQLGANEGALSEIESARTVLIAEILAVRTANADANRSLAIAVHDLEIATKRVRSLESEITDLRAKFTEVERNMVSTVAKKPAGSRVKRVDMGAA